MKSLLSSKRSKAICVIGLVAISIAFISKKLIRYQSGGCIKGGQELTYKKVVKYYFSWELASHLNIIVDVQSNQIILLVLVFR